MLGDFQSDKRITDPAEIVGLTVSGVKERDELLLVEFRDGRFLVVRPNDGWGGALLTFDATIYADEALGLGLMGKAEFDAIKAADDADRKASTERHEREQYERLRAKFGGGGVDPG